MKSVRPILFSPLCRLFVCALPALFLPSNSRCEDGPRFSLQVTAAEGLKIGDRVELALQSGDPQFPADRIVDVSFEPDKALWHVETHWRQDLEPRAGEADNRWRAVIRPFKTGELELPAVAVLYRDDAGDNQEAAAQGAAITVNSVKSPGSQNDALIGYRGAMQIPFEWTWLWIAAGLILFSAIVGWYLVRWWTRREEARPIPVVPSLPPGLWALRELDRRSRLPVCQDGPAKAVFSHVSEVVRLYLGRRYDITAIDMTTTECLSALERLSPGEQVMRWLREFFEECDLVKFTRHEPVRERWATIWNDARLIVRATTPPEELGASSTARPEPEPTRQEVAV